MEHNKNFDLRDIVYFCDYDNIWKTEKWEDIEGFEGKYKISNFVVWQKLKQQRNKEQPLTMLSWLSMAALQMYLKW